MEKIEKVQLKNARKCRLMAGLAIEQAAKEIGVSRQSLYNYESGESTPTVARLKKMAELYGCDIKELF